MASVLYNIIIAPIELIIEIIFELIFGVVGQRDSNHGVAVIGVSIAVSLLTLPLYRRADVVQQKQREIQNKLSYWVNHIKKSFKGDERFMMLQSYYRMNGYSPISSLNGSISLLLEVPFFMAAYHFLSHLEVLNGASFGLISDLGCPDGLIVIDNLFGTFNLKINCLPIAMTAINCLSAAIYLKGFPIRDKVQTYGMAVIFLVLLYNSPSGLVVYWTCNNFFSLVKNIFYKIKNPRKFINILCPVFGVISTICIFYSGILNSRKKIIFQFIFLFVMFLPFIFSFFKPWILISNQKFFKVDFLKIKDFKRKDYVTLVLSGIFLTILTGLMIPSDVIASSPSEFIDLKQEYRNPLLFLISSVSIAAGFFIIWSNIITALCNKANKNFIILFFWILSGIFLINYLFFGRNLGVLSYLLIFEDDFSYSVKQKIINLLCIIIFIILQCYLFRHKKILSYIYTVLIICVSVIFVRNVKKTNYTLSQMSYLKDKTHVEEIKPIFHLSTQGKNVVVIMLDRAINGFVPYIMQEKPELKEKFSGFTYYPNTISFGAHTLFGAPPLFGGYEYTPTEINKKSNQLLVDKHNEALKLMPVLFSENGFKVTVTDPPFANYKWDPDLSIFDDYPQICKYTTIETYTKIFKEEFEVADSDFRFKVNQRNFFCYSIFRGLPLFFQKTFYDKGRYYSSMPYRLNHFYEGFIDSYSVLYYLDKLTEIDNSEQNYFTSIQNETTHSVAFLNLPDYTPQIAKDKVDDSYMYGGGLLFENGVQESHYHANMAALLMLGKWFDYLRENDLYDNTRIIIVSDHGKAGEGTEGLGLFKNMIMTDPEIDISFCNPILLVKDFNCHDFITSNEFMTNADVPYLALKDVITNPVNPFTNIPITISEKTKHPQLITSGHNHHPTEAYTFDTSDGEWFSVHDNIFEEANWQKVE